MSPIWSMHPMLFVRPSAGPLLTTKLCIFSLKLFWKTFNKSGPLSIWIHYFLGWDFHYKDKMVMRLSYLYNENSYPGTTTSVYWHGPQMPSSNHSLSHDIEVLHELTLCYNHAMCWNILDVIVTKMFTSFPVASVLCQAWHIPHYSSEMIWNTDLCWRKVNIT